MYELVLVFLQPDPFTEIMYYKQHISRTRISQENHKIMNSNKNISKNNKNILQSDKRCGRLMTSKNMAKGGRNMWDDRKSLILSKTCVVIFMVLLVACAIFAPWLVARLTQISIAANTAGRALFLTTIYLGCVPAAALLVCLYILLYRIGTQRVFVGENTTTLRHISWCCFAGALICSGSALYYIPWLAIGISAAFVGLIVRVVKNVIAKAVSLQDDADYTI